MDLKIHLPWEQSDSDMDLSIPHPMDYLVETNADDISKLFGGKRDPNRAIIEKHVGRKFGYIYSGIKGVETKDERIPNNIGHHFITRAMQRKFAPDEIIDTVKNPDSYKITNSGASTDYYLNKDNRKIHVRITKRKYITIWDMNVPPEQDYEIKEVLEMFDKDQLEFLEKELKGNGVKFESVQNILDTDPKAIRNLLIQIQEEQSELSGGWLTDDNGEEVYVEADEKYNPYREGMAEDIEQIIMYHELHTK